IIGTAGAIPMVPANPAPPGALFWAASLLAASVVIVPCLRVRTGVMSVLKAEHLLMLGLVYWLLLDLLQGAYPLVGLQPAQVAPAFLSIGTLAVGIWIGVIGNTLKPPNSLLKLTEFKLSS